MAGLSELGVPGIPQILASQLTLPQPGGADYAYHITIDTPWFLDLPTALGGNPVAFLDDDLETLHL